MNELIKIVGRTPWSAAGPLAGFVAGIALAAVLAMAQTPATGPSLNFTATTDNVAGAPDSIRITLFRWSTDNERDQLLAAWNLTAKPETRGRGGRSGGLDATGPALAGSPPAGGRGGRGRGGNAGAAPAPPMTPESSLAAELDKLPTLGYLWSSEVTGYALHYAARVPEQGGGERIIFITDRRLGAWNDLWKPVGPGATNAPATNYEFSLIELHLNAKGEGDGKTTLTGKVAVDSAAKTIGLENYGALPVILKNVKRRTS